MLGKIPFVSISDNRLGGTENSSLRYFSATRALEFSTSRMVRPSFSRRVRRLFPAGSIVRVPQGQCKKSYQSRQRYNRLSLKLVIPRNLLRNPNTPHRLSRKECRRPIIANRCNSALRWVSRNPRICSDFVTRPKPNLRFFSAPDEKP